MKKLTNVTAMVAYKQTKRVNMHGNMVTFIHLVTSDGENLYYTTASNTKLATIANQGNKIHIDHCSCNDDGTISYVKGVTII